VSLLLCGHVLWGVTLWGAVIGAASFHPRHLSPAAIRPPLIGLAATFRPESNENSVIILPVYVMLPSPLIGSRPLPLPPPLFGRVPLLTPLCAPLRQAAETPLHFAASNGHLECVTALLEAGADKEAKSDVRPRNPGPNPLPPSPSLRPTTVSAPSGAK
jgi:hypothetical protein